MMFSKAGHTRWISKSGLRVKTAVSVAHLKHSLMQVDVSVHVKPTHKTKKNKSRLHRVVVSKISPVVILIS